MVATDVSPSSHNTTGESFQCGMREAGFGSDSDRESRRPSIGETPLRIYICVHDGRKGATRLAT